MRKALVLSAFALATLFGVDPAAREVKSVYLLRMGNGLDQYLASELTRGGVYTVTTDPQLADAIFTDSLGEGFEKKMKELYPPPPPPPPPPAPAKTDAKDAKKDEKKDEKDSDKGEKQDLLLGDAPMQRVGGSSMGRGKGTLFLVDRKTRNLLWSMNRQPKNTSTKELVTQAQKMVARLKADLGQPTVK